MSFICFALLQTALNGTSSDRCFAGAEPSTEVSNKATTNASAIPTLVLAGDSGVTDEHGWGAGFKKCLTSGIKCLNLSASGRSSKSFRTDGFWDKVVAAKGDYVLINFGGNDQTGKGPARETDPNTTYKENMGRYVDEIRAYGGKPILVAPMIRRFFDKEGKIHSSLQPYVDALKQLAAEKHVPLLDLHGRTITLFESMGATKTDELAPVKNGKLDRSHLNAKGGDIVGQLAADELRTQVPELAQYLVAPATTSPVQ